MKNGKKSLSLVLALVLIVSCFAVGGTIAWLTAPKQSVTNTFLVGDVGQVKVEETDEDKQFTIVPGVDITKDPKVSYDYDANKTGDFGVPAYIFVKVEAEGWTMSDDGMTYTIGNATTSDLVKFEINPFWKHLEGGVYYTEVAQDTDLEPTSVIKGDTITVSGEIVKEDVAGIAAAADTVIFSAYAIQKDGVGTVAEAWEKLDG